MNLLNITFLFICLLTFRVFSEENSEDSSALGHEKETAKNTPETESVSDLENWIGDFESIEVVIYDCSEESSSALIQEGKFHKGLKQEWTRRLSKKDAEKVISSITGKHEESGGTLCYEPHHGFVFYDKNRKILGCLEVCLSCQKHRSYPKKGLSKNWNLGQLGQIIISLGLHEDWAKFFDGELKNRPDTP